MSATLKLEIVTPEGGAYSDAVDMVTLPGSEGELGIFPMHVPLMTQVVPGEILVKQGAEQFILAVGDGFAEITGDRVSILTDMAVKAENIDEAKVEEARRRAEARLREQITGEELATVEAALVNATVQLQVKRKHKR